MFVSGPYIYIFTTDVCLLSMKARGETKIPILLLMELRVDFILTLYLQSWDGIKLQTIFKFRPIKF